MLGSTLTTAAGALLAVVPLVSGAGLYPKSSQVLQIDGKNYDNLIAKSNYTSVSLAQSPPTHSHQDTGLHWSTALLAPHYTPIDFVCRQIVEFYAPWCGHCQNLKPAYEKAAKNLEGLAQVAAVNCDDDDNKAFCGKFGVQGFPTLKIVRPGSKKGKPVVEDYQGERSAKGIVNAVVDKINNHVKRVSDKEIDDFLSKNNDSAKALLFTEKGTTSALLKSIAIDFLDVITVGQVRNTQTKAVELFGIKSFPTLVLLPGGDKDGIAYDGDLKKLAMVEFLSQVAPPNPISASPKPRTKSSKPKKAGTTYTEASSEPTTEAEEKVTEPVDDANIQKPVVFEGPLPIPIINEKEKLISNCLNQKAHTCVLAFVPKEDQSETAKKALAGLAELSHKHAQSKRHLFPMYEVHFEDGHSVEALKALELSPSEVHVVAINARRGWWKLLEGGDYGHESIENWIDQIRMSEGVKRKLPEGFVVEVVDEKVSATEAAPEASSEPTPEPTDDAAADATTTTPKVTPDAEAVSDTTVSDEEPTAWSGADPTVQEDTAAAEKPTEKAHTKDEL